MLTIKAHKKYIEKLSFSPVIYEKETVLFFNNAASVWSRLLSFFLLFSLKSKAKRLNFEGLRVDQSIILAKRPSQYIRVILQSVLIEIRFLLQNIAISNSDNRGLETIIR